MAKYQDNDEEKFSDLVKAWSEIQQLKLALDEQTKTLAAITEQNTALIAEIASLQEAAKTVIIVPETANTDIAAITPVAQPVVELSQEQQDWKDKYDKIKAAYVQTRLDVSGSFGNWDFLTRKRVLEHEISAELGFII